MIRHTDSLILVWRIAEIEANHLGSKEIEPEHLFLGLLKVVDVDIGKVLSKLDSKAREPIEEDVHFLRALFDEFLVDTTFMRRRLRKQLPRLPERRGDSKIKLRRSAKSRKLFTHAEAVSKAASGGNVFLIHLMAAILDLHLPEVEGVLDAANVSPGEFGSYISGIAAHGKKVG